MRYHCSLQWSMLSYSHPAKHQVYEFRNIKPFVFEVNVTGIHFSNSMQMKDLPELEKKKNVSNNVYETIRNESQSLKN